jgi:hypothetical protein
MTVTHASVAGLAARIGHMGHELYMNIFFLFPALFDDVHTKTINCYGTISEKGYRRILDIK